MPKGFFTQGIAVLFERSPTLDAITAAIGDPIVRRADEDRGWLGGPSVVVAHRPQVNGYVAIDVVDEVWPDHMGSPDGAPELFAAWSMGNFGPFVHPGSLERARLHAWHMEKKPDALVQRHRAFARVRLSYVFGAEPDTKVFPADVDAVKELEAVHTYGRRLLDVPGALALFNPNADMLLTPALFDTFSEDARNAHRLPIDVWTNTRLHTLDGVVKGWRMMDSVGLRQLDRTELEVCFPDSYEERVIARFVKNVALYVANTGDVISDGDTLDGPDGIWCAHLLERGLVDPPRPVIRLSPSSSKLPAALAR